ncbi:MAG: glycoside hydrolase family 3 C-terminal domain-containing protein [Oscillospiraceae bacterium]|nr:glycoside hydrolase family 3 C-terminal domain-containing protein [Oscillospiraceae bacterium]
MELLTKASYEYDPNQRELDNLKLAYEAACESIVLLKNDGALPFSHKKVALYGAGATMTIKGGTGSGEVNERHCVTILEGLEDRGFTVTTKKWIDDFAVYYRTAKEAYETQKRKRINIFKMDDIMQMLFDNFRLPAGPAITESDLGSTEQCVYVLSRQAGEGGDRKVEKGDYLLSDEELAHIRFCAEHYEKFVLVINCGSSMELSALDEIPGIHAILYICQLGSEGGHAVADILSGAVTPSGKLSDTWAKHYDDIPFAREYSYLNGNLEQEYYKEGIYVGYRYFDSFGVAPAYPFGFGLSYTDFTIRFDSLTAKGSGLTVTAEVTNTGNFPGKEVVQLYASAPDGALCKEYQSLAAFSKTRTLAPGESQLLELSFDMTQLASYREADNCYVLEKGDYILRLGNSSRSTQPVCIAALENEAIVSRHTAICPRTSAFEELSAAFAPEVLPELLRVTIPAGAIETVTYSYETPAVCQDPRVQAFLDTLSLEEMAEIVVGIGMFGGTTRFTLPGSVGNTTSKFWDRGLANVALCDGPAGLRIQKRSTVTAKGKVKPVEMPMSVFEAFPGFVKKLMTGDPSKEPVLYQYATAFPVANALAQTWNVPLLHRIGQAIAKEMSEYGCTYWLAPAVNIHRNPLCGRNFEYFSEDPYLSGIMSTALTQGIQETPGCYVTVKHFACNNQEDNRNFVSSEVSQRALREIYLRPFEYAVRKGGAKGIMTSYNKVNGIYSPNSCDLCTKVLRNEWGFRGVVMTDWFSTNPGQADNAIAMQAGNDLIMPGGGTFKRAILKGIKSGKIQAEDLRRCCGNVVQAIFESATQKEYITR